MSEKISTYVMPDPIVTRTVDGEYRLTGKNTPVKKIDNVIDALREAGVYNSKADIYNGPVNLSYKTSAEGMPEAVDEILSIIDRKKLGKDLSKKGHAFLTTKERSRFTDHRGKGLIANADRIVQDLIYQELSKELEPVRHLKLQESVELMQSDEKYRAVMSEYSAFNLEDIGKETTSSENVIHTQAASVLSFWDKRASALAGMPLETTDYMVAALKSANSMKI